MTINATPKSPTANSYCTQAFADDYFTSRFNSSAWINASATDKETSLIQATIMLDSLFEWNGELLYVGYAQSGQSLRWPRYNAYDNDGRFLNPETVPLRIMQAECEMAIFLLENPTYSGNVREIDEVRISSIKINFDNNSSNFPIATRVIDMLHGFGMYKGQSKNGVGVVGLIRS